MINEYLKTIDAVIENGKFKDNWESLSKFLRGIVKIVLEFLFIGVFTVCLHISANGILGLCT